jgi:hypothetical protein
MRITGKNISIYTLCNLGKYSRTFSGAYLQLQKPLLICFILLLLMIFTQPAGLNAQEIRRTSLFGWEEVTKHMIKDRYHNYGGIFYDRGLYRFTTPEMIREHKIQLMIYDFTTLDDYNWFYKENNSFRAFAGSYSLGEFIHEATIRNKIPVSEKLKLPLNFTRRYDIHSDRALLEMGLDYNINNMHHIGIAHTLTEQKPDLDATFYYRYGTLPERFIQVEVSPLDWANNAAFNLSQRRDTFAPELRKYDISPFLFSMKASSILIYNLRGEIVGGIQTVQQSIGESMEGSEDSFRDRERTRYLGLLLEYNIPHFTISVSWQHRYAKFNRTNVETNIEEPVNYGNYQIENKLGFFISVSYGQFFIDNWIWLINNRDKQFDKYEEEFRAGYQIYPFDFEENRLQMRNRLGFDPVDNGFKAAVEWSADYRDFLKGIYDHPNFGVINAFDYREYYRRLLINRNGRITLFFGYRFNKDIYFEMGASYNVDGDIYRGTYNQVRHKPTRFAGGFGRMVLYW